MLMIFRIMIIECLPIPVMVLHNLCFEVQHTFSSVTLVVTGPFLSCKRHNIIGFLIKLGSLKVFRGYKKIIAFLY